MAEQRYWTVYNRPYEIQAIALMLVLILSLPGLLEGAWNCIRGRWAQGSRRLLVFFGLLVVVPGIEGASHPLIPYGTAPWPCQGGYIYERWHQLHHTFVAGVPLALLYWFALRKWQPSVAWFG